MNRRVAAVLIALGLAAAGVGLVARVGAEQAGRTVEIVLDLSDARTVADRQGLPLADYLARMRAAGAQSVAVSEATLAEMAAAGAIELWQGHQLRGLAGEGAARRPELAPALDPATFAPGHYYAIADDPEFGLWLAGQLQRKLGDAARLVSPAGSAPVVVRLGVTAEQVEKQGMGLLETDLALVRAAGLQVVPRVENVLDAGDGYIGATLDRAGPDTRLLMFNGRQALGYPNRLGELAEEMTARGLLQGLIEAPVQLGFVEQAGQVELAQQLDYQAVRVYGIARAELDRYTVDDVRDRQVRAVKERNIRVVYVRPVLVKADPGTLAETNIAYVGELADDLRAAGFRLGPAQPFGAVHPAKLLLALMAAGVIAAGVLLLQQLLPVPDRWVQALLALGVLGSAGLLAVSGGATLRKLLALAAAVVFPALAALWAARLAVRRQERGGLGSLILRAAGVLAGAVGIALVGGLFVGAMLGADSRYLLEIDYFRGVKVQSLLPAVLAGWAFVAQLGVRPEDEDDAPRHRGLFRQLHWVAGQPVRAWHLALLGLAAVALYILVGRTGHTAGLTVSAAEVEARGLLERWLVVRPRTKEFLLGHPALMLAVWAGAQGLRRWAGLLTVAGALALASLVNSFSHLRTELLVSLWRTGNGLLLGLIVGAVALAVAQAAWPWLRRQWPVAADTGGRSHVADHRF